MNDATWLPAVTAARISASALTGRDATGHDAARLIMRLGFACASYPGLAEAIAAYLAQTGTRTDGACFAVVGPVVGDRVNLASHSASQRRRLRRSATKLTGPAPSNRWRAFGNVPAGASIIVDRNQCA